MTIWILALVLFASGAGIGFRSGAIRVAFSLLGIPVAALFAGPLSRFVSPILYALGVTSPILVAIIAPLIVFCVILTVFKVAGFAVHKKVEVYYRYTAGDLRFALWERLNSRLGLCLGIVNGLVYFVLICTLIYMGSYWTVQLATPDLDLKAARYLNTMGHDLQATGMNKVAVAANRMPDAYFQAADIVGLIYQNPLLEARLSRYPAFLSLAEQPDLKQLANDSSYTEMLMTKAPIGEVFKNDRTQAILNNKDLLQTIRNTVGPNLEDLRVFLETGKSQKFDDPILGRWYYDGRASVAAYRALKPNLPSSEVGKIRRWMYGHFNKMTLIVAADNQDYLKNFPKKDSKTLDLGDSQGTWKKNDDNYTVSFDGDDRQVEVDDNHMTVKGLVVPMVLDKEE